MTTQPKKIRQTEVQVGDIIADYYKVKDRTVLECVKINADSILFKYVSGIDKYVRNSSGLLTFENKDNFHWYLIKRKQPTVKPQPKAKMTQRAALLQAFIDKKTLTGTDAFLLTGTLKLPQRVKDFEEMGLKFNRERHDFVTRYKTVGRCVKYSLVNKSDAKKLLKGMQKSKK